MSAVLLPLQLMADEPCIIYDEKNVGISCLDFLEREKNEESPLKEKELGSFQNGVIEKEISGPWGEVISQLKVSKTQDKYSFLVEKRAKYKLLRQAIRKEISDSENDQNEFKPNHTKLLIQLNNLKQEYLLFEYYNLRLKDDCQKKKSQVVKKPINLAFGVIPFLDTTSVKKMIEESDTIYCKRGDLLDEKSLNRFNQYISDLKKISNLDPFGFASKRKEVETRIFNFEEFLKGKTHNLRKMNVLKIVKPQALEIKDNSFKVLGGTKSLIRYHKQK